MLIANDDCGVMTFYPNISPTISITSVRRSGKRRFTAFNHADGTLCTIMVPEKFSDDDLFQIIPDKDPRETLQWISRASDDELERIYLMCRMK